MTKWVLIYWVATWVGGSAATATGNAYFDDEASCRRAGQLLVVNGGPDVMGPGSWTPTHNAASYICSESARP